MDGGVLRIDSSIDNEQQLPLTETPCHDEHTTPERSTANMRRKRALPSPFLRAAASPGHSLQMQKIFQEAKTSLQRDMAFASSSSGSIASRLPQEESSTAMLLPFRPLPSSRTARTGFVPKDWRYSCAPPFLAKAETDVREPLQADQELPCIPARFQSIPDHSPSGVEPVSSGFSSPVNMDVELENVPPLSQSAIPRFKSIPSQHSIFRSDDNVKETTVAPNQVFQEAGQPSEMRSTDLEQPMGRMAVSQVDSWLHDVMDASHLRAQTPEKYDTNPLSTMANMPSTDEYSPELPPYISPSMEAAGESAKMKRYFLTERSSDDKENIPPDSGTSDIPLAGPFQFQYEGNPNGIMFPERSPDSVLQIQSSPVQYEDECPSLMPLSFTSTYQSARLKPSGHLRRVSSSGSPLHIVKSPPSPLSHIRESYNTANLAANSSKFRKPPIKGMTKYYPRLSQRGLSSCPSSHLHISPHHGSHHRNAARSVAAGSLSSWKGRDRMPSLTSQWSSYRSRTPSLRHQPQFWSSPPRQTNYQTFSSQQSRFRTPRGHLHNRQVPTYQCDPFEVMEDFNAVGVLDEPGPQTRRVENVQVGYDQSGARRQDHQMDQNINTNAIQPFVEDIGMAELSPNVTPYRKAYGWREKGYMIGRVSPIKRKRCPSYYDDDILSKHSSLGEELEEEQGSPEVIKTTMVGMEVKDSNSEHGSSAGTEIPVSTEVNTTDE